MRTAIALSLAFAAALSGCSQGAADESSDSTGSMMSSANTDALGRRLSPFVGRWLTKERRADEVDIAVKTFDDERGGYNTDVRFETTNLVLRYQRFEKIDGGEICYRTIVGDKTTDGCATSKLSPDGRALTNTTTERIKDKNTDTDTVSVRIQKLALEGETLHYTDVTDGTTKADLVLEWDDKQPPR